MQEMRSKIWVLEKLPVVLTVARGMGIKKFPNSRQKKMQQKKISHQFWPSP